MRERTRVLLRETRADDGASGRGRGLLLLLGRGGGGRAGARRRPPSGGRGRRAGRREPSTPSSSVAKTKRSGAVKRWLFPRVSKTRLLRVCWGGGGRGWLG